MTPFDNLSELPVQNTRVSGRMGLGTWLITRLPEHGNAFLGIFS